MYSSTESSRVAAAARQSSRDSGESEGARHHEAVRMN